MVLRWSNIIWDAKRDVLLTRAQPRTAVRKTRAYSNDLLESSPHIHKLKIISMILVHIQPIMIFYIYWHYSLDYLSFNVFNRYWVLIIISNSAIMSMDPEKSNVQEVERTESEPSDDARISAFTPEQQRKIIRHVDWRLVTTLGFLYACSLVDRTNLGSANIAG